MKKILTITLFSFFISCTPGLHPDYTSNLETAKKILELQGTEADLDAQLAMIHEDLQWQPAFHGSKEIGKTEFGAYLKGWHDAMEDVLFTPRNWLPGVSPETGLADGSVRTYGKWKGIHSASGKSWELIGYHTWDFKDGKVIAGGDYFDAGGLMNSLKEEVVEDATE
ncbi:MAG: ketosteroid isomerase-like protein [Flavobacteriaceae bacterium]|jgi:ketosteroid isomerase-like protein|tara:strand:- start:4863 stop:5363 length:501 start_codon:yes stop_codon:yes gene_type:complete